jgi:hypothetical protein
MARIERTASRIRPEPQLELGEIYADIGQYLLDNPADRTRTAGDRAARGAHPSGDGGPDAGAPDRGRIRDPLSRGFRATAICVIWILTFLMGAWIYTKYRIYVRIPIEQAGYWKTQGFFELKEHAATLGLGLLPIYWYIWKNAHDPEYDGVRKSVTALLAFICWFNFLVGHVLNNVRGFGS